MRSATVAAAWLLVGIAAAGAEGDPAYRARGLAPNDAAVIEPLMLDRAEVHDFVAGDRRLAVHATPDGFVRLDASDAPVAATVTGASGARATFEVRPGERVAVWPVRRAEIRARPSGLSAEITGADWAFVIRADRASPEGLPVRCGGRSCLLMAGWRLAMDRRGDEVVFRVVQREWPGEVVEEPKPKPPGRPAAGAAPQGADAARAAPPLPVVGAQLAAWEVAAPEPVSP